MTEINKDMTIGEIIEKVPNCQPVIEKYFQGACFGCPATKMETLEMGAMVHGVDVNEVISELKELVNKN